MAAGYATRLYPLTREYPKPLLAVKNRPIIDYILDKLEHAGGLEEIIVVTNSKFIKKFREWARQKKSKKKLRLLDDLTSTLEDRRGAIGDMDFAISALRIRDDLLVIGGDNLFDGDIGGFLRFARSKKRSPVIGAFDIADKAHARHYGVVKLGPDQKIADFQEKPKSPRSTLVAMCLYYFPRDMLGLVAEYTGNRRNNNDTTGSYINWLRKRVPVFGFVFGGRWYDIGDREFLDEAKRKF